MYISFIILLIQYQRVFSGNERSPAIPRFLRPLSNPLHELRNFLVDNGLTAGVSRAISGNQIAGVEATRDDVHRHSRCADQWTARSQFGANTALSPWIESTIGIYQPRTVIDEPATCVVIDVCLGLAQGNTIGFTIWTRRKEEAALSDPIIGGDQTADNTGTIGWGSVLPVAEWLITQHPIPLPINRIAQTCVREEW